MRPASESSLPPLPAAGPRGRRGGHPGKSLPGPLRPPLPASATLPPLPARPGKGGQGCHDPPAPALPPLGSVAGGSVQAALHTKRSPPASHGSTECCFDCIRFEPFSAAKDLGIAPPRCSPRLHRVRPRSPPKAVYVPRPHARVARANCENSCRVQTLWPQRGKTTNSQIERSYFRATRCPTLEPDGWAQ
jgi:hypothetical protein